jgi:DNA-binding beta-propeller fold protein YncE
VTKSPAHASEPLALVTCDTEARVAVVDLARGVVVRSLPVLPAPRSIERVGGGDALVCHTTTGAVTVIDGSTLRVRHVLRNFVEPRYTAAHPAGRYAFVTDSGSHEVVSVDVLRGITRGRARLPEWARHVSIDSAGRTLWVGLGTASDRIALVDVRDPARPRLVRTVRPPFPAHDVGFLPDGRHVWVTSGDRGATALLDGRGEVRLRLPAGTAPQHVSFADDRTYVTSGADGTLTVHSLRDGRVERRTQVPVGSYNVQTGHAALVVSPSLDRGTLCVLDRRGVLVHEVRVAPSSHDACFVG